ncbi:SusD/RagB family nutrient-binding outer membrane lipoprotein [Flavobacteriaceae bacterium XHP0103]|uniref:SusD/RagB family nutrient-binding outer membrane lipoprotein n=1 Tax=Marixanthotalea marina TaxID=2844359 RepID=UPI002989E27C|nr:SusD/RagB family nutrient-binding outer membrane lipoprotein [Marixanthotalea marina]MBU3821874.1 SusD/RagB family nutrient-binding outer membrane lipoprotein [Marixanthotalea marina]
MKNILKILFLSIMVVSCEKDLDINTNPNTPIDVDKRFVLTAAQGSLATVLGGDLTNLGGFLAQYHTQAPSASQYLNIDTYNMQTDFANRSWQELYAGCLNDLSFVKQRSDEEGDTGSYLIATLLESYTFQVLTDLFGPVPYSQALLGSENINPAPDSGEEIYMGLISSINQALNKYNSSPVASTVGAQDAIYGAEMDDWIRFANTLKLKMYLRMAYTSQANSSAVLNLLAEDNFLASDAEFNVYSAAVEENKNHPFYDVQIDHLGDVNNVASASLLDFYTENSDPRIAAVYRTNSSGIFRSLDQGDRGSFAASLASAFSRPNIVPNTPVYLMTVAESNFLQAEALVRYSSGAGAKTKYDEGIINSFLTYGLTVTEAQSFIESGGAYEYVSTGVIETDIRQIMIQKWASLAYINNIEAFFELSRTKYPEIVPFGDEDYSIGNLIVSINSVLPGDQTPKTIFYPDNEVDRNSNLNQKQSLTEPIWWDQKQ